jgi:hypothetical protein
MRMWIDINTVWVSKLDTAIVLSILMSLVIFGWDL